MTDLVLLGWAMGATASSLYFARRMAAAQRKARIAVNMAADAVQAKVEMERNTPVLMLMGPEGQPTATQPLPVVRWWLN